MSSSVVRSEMHALASTPATRADVARTIAAYRRAVRALCGVIMVHWPEIATARSRSQAVESLFHITAKRPVVRYALLDRIIGKMPSYLRRAAIEHALGAVASFLSNWDNWVDGRIGGKQRMLGARAPRLGLSGVYPSLYGGNMVLYGPGLRTVEIKLLGDDGQWRFSDPFPVKGQFKRVSPLTGTVIARRFLTCGRHNARRDALADVIASRQCLSGRVCRGERHCVALHRRVQGLNLDAARQLASELAAFAAQHGAEVFVIEDLKGWRPKAPSRAMRKRFDRFQHRALVQALAYKAQETGARLLQVLARGTSRWAYDGSGKVIRSRRNAQLATFPSGKQYNADLNGALNIAARGLSILMGIEPERLQTAAGRSSGADARMPLVLADVWAHAQTTRGTSHQPAAPVGV